MFAEGFSIRKAAQVVAFFARAQGGKINVLKLVKLVYLSDREFMDQYGEPMLYDRMVSMDHGPVNSTTLNLINGLSADDQSWSEFVGTREGNDIALAHGVTDAQLDELSVAELKVLRHVWVRFGRMGKYEVRDYTHKNCPEWEDPNGTSTPIPYARIFKFLGKDNAKSLARNIEETRSLGAIFSRSQDYDITFMDAP